MNMDIKTSKTQIFSKPKQKSSFIHNLLLVTTLAVIGLVITNIYLAEGQKNQDFVLGANTFQLIQADWSGGTGAGTASNYLTATDINDDTAGKITISTKEDWCDNDSCDNNWQKRKTLTISNSGSGQTDYQVKISIPFTEGMKSNFADLRFTSSSGQNLDFWLQSKTDSTTATIWIKVNTLDAGDNEIFMYYDNDNAVSTSNGENTFLFFDDFNNDTIDASKWIETDNVNNEITASGGTLNFTRLSNDNWTKGMRTVNSFDRTSNLSFDFDYIWTVNNSAYDAIMAGWHDNSTGVSYTNMVYATYNNGSGSATTIPVYIYEDGTRRNGVSGNWILSTQYQVQVKTKATGAIYEKSSDDGTTWETNYSSSYSSESNLHAGWAFYSGTHKYDNARIRKWMTIEPTVTFGEEEFQYNTEATLVSNIFEVNEENDTQWDNLVYTTSDEVGVKVKVRTGIDIDMSNSVPFVGCTEIANNTDISDSICAIDGHKFIQYKVILTGDGTSTPEFSNIIINGSAVPPEATPTPTATPHPTYIYVTPSATPISTPENIPTIGISDIPDESSLGIADQSTTPSITTIPTKQDANNSTNKQLVKYQTYLAVAGVAGVFLIINTFLTTYRYKAAIDILHNDYGVSPDEEQIEETMKQSGLTTYQHKAVTYILMAFMATMLLVASKVFSGI